MAPRAQSESKREEEDRLKSALYFSIGQILDEETLALNTNATPQFIGALTELVWAQIESVAGDLEIFAGHAGRKTIATDDVMLLARRNEGLETVLKKCLEGLGGRDGKGKTAAKGKGKAGGKEKASKK